MELSTHILSDITVYMKYARYLPDKKRRETWEEIVTRNKNMHIKEFPALKDEIESVYKLVYKKKVLPSMRGLQFGGKAIEVSPNRQYNCSYISIDNWEAFPEVMFLLLGGSGVGFSVQKHHIEQLPEIRPHLKRSRRYLIEDSIEGWADAVRILVKSYFFGLSKPRFDYSMIREQGTLLKTSGGRAPGPQPLKDCIHNLSKIFDSKQPGEKLTPLEAHDMICYIMDAVLAGGIRRAAGLSLFSIDDEAMLTAKYGNWWELNPQRGRANNSAVILRHKIRKQKFMKLWERIKESGSGEPGIFFTNDKEWGLNPCSEISLKSKQFCNLTTINTANITSQEDLEERAKAAAFIGTLQAAYTDFHYIRDVWSRNTEKDALIGVSMTGIASGAIFNYDIEKAAKLVVTENERVASLLQINSAKRTTCVKPEGTSSLVLGCSSGVHSWFAPYYIRRIRVLKTEAIYKYMLKHIPKLIENDFFKSSTQAIISIPIKAPDNAVFSSEPAISLLERIKKLNTDWIQPGHIDGENTNNISATIYVKEEEWDEVAEWMWANRSYYNGLTVLPKDNTTYKQAPLEEITKEKYEEMLVLLKEIDITKIKETEDNTRLKEQAACSGGACEIL